MNPQNLMSEKTMNWRVHLQLKQMKPTGNQKFLTKN